MCAIYAKDRVTLSSFLTIRNVDYMYFERNKWRHAQLECPSKLELPNTHGCAFIYYHFLLCVAFTGERRRENQARVACGGAEQALRGYPPGVHGRSAAW